jgi:DNA polymerase-3 subunit gamma/tau
MYQVLARKWRPQRFEDVLGQQAVTRTLKNALKSKRIAQAFVFSGPRGCGKTTTARILARALNCVKGPTPEPCGQCDACIEIAEGRDIDVLEIDAATHTGVDNVREVVIEGLAITPVRNRYKVFIIDEVHMLSASSFNALLKSIEEPPPHVIFMMATTEQHKIPDTVLSRSQLYEFRTISAKTVAERLRLIAGEEQIEIPDEGLMLLARAGEGSMRDSLSAFDQVRAFAGDTIAVDDVVTVLGLIGRDLVLDMLDAVVVEDAPSAFALVERAIERGYDLRLLCREIARAARDLLILSVDAKRASDPDVAGDAERERLLAMAGQWSREDLLRAFDLLAKAESDIKGAAQPRYHLEMALLRWIYLRKLTPIEDLIAGTARIPSPPQTPPRPAPAQPRTERVPPPVPPQPPKRAQPDVAPAPAPAGNLKDSLLAEIRKSKGVFYGTVVAQAQKIEVGAGKVTFTFSANQTALRTMFEQNRAWLESVAEKLAGRKILVDSVQAGGAGEQGTGQRAEGEQTAADGAPATRQDRKTALKEQAMADAGVKALLEVFPAEIRDVEEM